MGTGFQGWCSWFPNCRPGLHRACGGLHLLDWACCRRIGHSAALVRRAVCLDDCRPSVRNSSKIVAQRKARSWSLQPASPPLPRISLPTPKRAPRRTPRSGPKLTIRPSADSPKRTSASAGKPGPEGQGEARAEGPQGGARARSGARAGSGGCRAICRRRLPLYEPTAADYSGAASDEELQANARMLESARRLRSRARSPMSAPVPLSPSTN